MHKLVTCFLVAGNDKDGCDFNKKEGVNPGNESDINDDDRGSGCSQREQVEEIDGEAAHTNSYIGHEALSAIQVATTVSTKNTTVSILFKFKKYGILTQMQRNRSLPKGGCWGK
jgi:hypothetical protein